jgi:hypothetical protein
MLFSFNKHVVDKNWVILFTSKVEYLRCCDLFHRMFRFSFNSYKMLKNKLKHELISLILLNVLYLKHLYVFGKAYKY